MRDILKERFLDAQDFLEEGRFALAIKTYKDALGIAKKNDLEEYLALTYLALAFDDIDDLPTAMKHSKRALEVAEKVFGTGSREYAVALSNSAMMSSNRMMLDVAEPMLDEALDILNSLKTFECDENDQLVLANAIEVFANAADCKAKLGKLNETVELMKTAYQSAKDWLPPLHPKRIQYTMELGSLLFGLGYEKESNKLKKEALNALNAKSMNPFLAITIVEEASRNSAITLNSMQIGGPSKRKSRKKVASNVVRLFPEKTKKKSVAKAPPSAGYQIKISLKNVQPEVWRRVVVRSDSPLTEVHEVIQKAMGWDNSHLHEFRVKGKRYSNSSNTLEAKNERDFTLGHFDFSVGSKFEYEYDFGDGWVHMIRVEKCLNESDLETARIFVDARGACPPEDCGGPYGFAHLLQRKELEDPDDLPEWLSEFDPEEVPKVFKAEKSVSKKSQKVRTQV